MHDFGRLDCKSAQFRRLNTGISFEALMHRAQVKPVAFISLGVPGGFALTAIFNGPVTFYLLLLLLCIGLVAAGWVLNTFLACLVPLTWLAISIPLDLLTWLEVLPRPQDDWIPFTVAAPLDIPAGALLIALGVALGRHVRRAPNPMRTP